MLTAALLLGSSAVAARAGDDSFFTDLGKATDAGDAADPVGPPDPVASDSSLVPRPDGSNHAADQSRAADAVVDKPSWDDLSATPAPEQALQPVGWAPEHGNARRVVQSGAVPNADPEPNAPVVPPATAPHDPLDKAADAAAGTPGGSTAAPAVAPEPLPPLNAALKAALDKRAAQPLHGPNITEQRKERNAIAFFYAARNFSPVWSQDGHAIPAVASVLLRLANAGDDALTISDVPKALQSTGSLEAVVGGELDLTAAVVAYARQASGSRLDPHSISALIGYRPDLADPAEVIEQLTAAGTGAGDKLHGLNPPDPRYAALRQKLAAMRRGTPQAGGKILPGVTLHVGMRDPRVPLLRTRLGLPDIKGDQRYDELLADAVADFQRAHDLPPNGWLTRRTVAALVPDGKPSRLEGTLIANMEMWRWMPRERAGDRIEVNVPDYLVTVYRDNSPVSQHRVVVGKPDTPTPLFANTMKYLIVNPYWNVPQSIIKNEMLPKGGGSLAYLQGRGYSVSWRGGMATVKQLPGEKNALGRIKFLFPNDYSVYLHDTPSKSLFAASRRAFSHGCVRVDQPFSFAETVLNDATPDDARKRWSEDRLKDMIGDKERYVNLPTPLPIEIAYFTASVDDGGRVKTREDIYGYIHAIATALGQDSDPAPKVPREKPLVAERSHRHASPADGDVDPEPDAVSYRRRSASADHERRRPADIDETTASIPAAPAPRSFWDSLFSPR